MLILLAVAGYKFHLDWVVVGMSCWVKLRPTKSGSNAWPWAWLSLAICLKQKPNCSLEISQSRMWYGVFASSDCRTTGDIRVGWGQEFGKTCLYNTCTLPNAKLSTNQKHHVFGHNTAHTQSHLWVVVRTTKIWNKNLWADNRKIYQTKISISLDTSKNNLQKNENLFCYLFI